MLVRFGALGAARLWSAWSAAEDCTEADEGILAPIWKLPPEGARRASRDVDPTEILRSTGQSDRDDL
jgi:hypothetical protein